MVRATKIVVVGLAGIGVVEIAERAKASLIQFAEQHGQRIAAFYTENVSGATLHRPELMRLIAESGEGDIVLVEQIDRLARLKQHNARHAGSGRPQRLRGQTPPPESGD